MNIITWILLGIVVLETAVLVVAVRALVKSRWEGRALDPVDIPPFSVRRKKAEDNEWEIVDDVIQYEDDRRAEFYRSVWAT